MRNQETHKSARIGIPRCFRIPKCFQNIIALKDFLLDPGTATTKRSQVLHCKFCCLSFPSSAFPTEKKMAKDEYLKQTSMLIIDDLRNWKSKDGDTIEKNKS